MWIRVAVVRFRPKLAPAEKRPHARYGRPGPARKRWRENISFAPSFELAAIRVTPMSKLHCMLISPSLAAVADLQAKRGWSGEISGLGVQTIYAHLSSIEVKARDMVARAHALGRSSATGLAARDCLHFAVLLQGCG